MGQEKRDPNEKILTIPDISVVIPAFNASETIPELIDSLKRQSFQNVEFILVNDGSSDKTKDVLQGLLKEHEQFKVINLDDNVGSHEARKIGTLKSQGKWITFADADDVIDDSFLTRMLDTAIETDSDIVICSADKINQSGKIIGRKVHIPEEKTVDKNIFDNFCNRSFGTASLWNKLYKSSLITPYITKSFQWRQDVGEDTLVNIGCFYDARRVTVLPDVLYHYRIHSKSATQSISSAKAYVEMLRAFAIALSTYTQDRHDIITNLLKLYSRQLQFECYQVQELEDLTPFAPDIAEALHIIADIAPQSLATLPQTCICVPKSIPSFRQTITYWKKSTNDVFRAMNRMITKYTINHSKKNSGSLK